MRILYIYQSCYPWDIRVEKICRSAIQAGHEIALLAAGGDGRPAAEELPDGIRVTRVTGPDGRRPPPIPWNRTWLRAAEALITRFRPQVVIVRDLPLAWTALRAAQGERLPVVFDMAENYPAFNAYVQRETKRSLRGIVYRNQWLGHLYERWAVRRMGRTWTVVEESSDRLAAAGLDPDRLTVVSNTPRLEASAPAVPPPDHRGSALRLIYVGQIEPLRGLDTAIRGLAQAHRAGAPTTLTVLGDDTRFGPGLRALAHDEGVGDQVQFLGMIPNHRIGAHIAQADVGIIPHVRNPFTDTTVPNKLFDYMRDARPVIASDCAPLKRILREEQCGETFPSGDAAALSRLLVEFWRHGDRLPAMGCAGLAAVQRRYHWEWDARAAMASLQQVVDVSAASRSARAG